jgi:hypothetical protein
MIAAYSLIRRHAGKGYTTATSVKTDSSEINHTNRSFSRTTGPCYEGNGNKAKQLFRVRAPMRLCHAVIDLKRRSMLWLDISRRISA